MRGYTSVCDATRSFSPAALVLFFTLSSGACVPAAPAAPPVVAPPQVELDLLKGVRVLASDLARQLGPASTGTRTLVIDPMLDARTGQQTGASQRLQQELQIAMGSALQPATILPFDDQGAASARLVVSGTVTKHTPPDLYRVSTALSDRQTGLVVAQAAVRFRQSGLSDSPSAFYSDSPALVRDRSVDGYLSTTETKSGNAADALYIEQIPTAAVIAQALDAYNAQRWEAALTLYTQVAARPDGQQLRTFNGIYLCNMRLGRLPEAEQAFGKMAALGLATNNLAVKLLFRPGSTDFWPDPTISSVYPMWLRQIARASVVAKSCLNVVGHTSASGTEQVNRRLSEARAVAIREWLSRDETSIAQTAKVSGMGARENMVGSGADDATDAIDRRVEFRVVPCGGG